MCKIQSLFLYNMIYYLYMNISIFILALIGLAISCKIYKNKKVKVYTCPVGSNCKTVLESNHNKFLGIPNEINGMIYYGLIAFAYAITLFGYETVTSLKTFLLAVTAIAFLFSIYLTLIQGLQLKKWCTWCIGSAIVSTAIFILTLLYTLPHLTDIVIFLSGYINIIVTIYSLGFALAIGAITSLYVLLYNFFYDFKISKKEKEVVHRITQIIWIGLMMVVVSGLCMTLFSRASAVISMFMIIISVTVISEAFFSLFAVPHLSKLSIKRKTIEGKLCTWRKVVFGIGAISITSLYSAFFLTNILLTSLNFYQLLFIYISLLTISALASQSFNERIINKFISQQKKK